MTFANEAKKAGRIPVTVVECDIDKCFKVFGASATNQCLQSEDLSTTWTYTDATVTANTARAPDGAQTADKLTNTGASGRALQTIGTFDGSQNTVSVFVKYVDAAVASILLDDNTAAATLFRLDVNFASDGSVSSVSVGFGSASSYGYEHIVDGWYRVWATSGATVSGNTRRLFLYPAGQTTDLASTLFWGVQLEVSAAVGHYTPTTTAAATGACTAVVGAQGKCYNTRETCQDAPNYQRGLKTYRFIEQQSNLPPDVDAIPSLVSVSAAPTKITPGKGLGHRASVTCTFDDHPHHDRGVDPYFSERTFDPMEQGTFWSKFLARNPHYNARTLRVLSGYIVTPWDWGAFDRREYVIDRIDGPDRSGRVKLVAKDILKLADDKRAKCPVATSGELTASLAAGVTTSFTVTTGTGSEYAASGYVRIGDEIIQYASRSGDTFSTLTRGTWGTADASHGSGDSVQMCQAWSSVNVRTVIDNLLVNFAGISATYINAADWDAEETAWLSTYSLTAIISDPTGVNKLLGELMEQCQLMLWWDDRAQQIRLKAIAPPLGNLPTTINDDEHLLADSLNVKESANDRVTQVWIYYAPKDYTDDKTGNYQRLYISADLDAESADQFGDKRIEVIKSRWFNITNSAAASQTAGRIFAARKRSPKIVTFALDAKDLVNYSVGDIIDIATDAIVDFNGAPKTVRGVLTDQNEKKQGTEVAYTLLSGVGQGRFGFIGPNTLGDYSAESSANKNSYAFIGNNTGAFSDGGERYKII